MSDRPFSPLEAEGWLPPEKAERLRARIAELESPACATLGCPYESALKGVSGALVDAATIPVPADPMGYADAIRALTGERDEWRARHKIALEQNDRTGARAEAAERERDAAVNAIDLILPLAKGYAAANPHESSYRYIKIAQDIVAPAPKVD